MSLMADINIPDKRGEPDYRALTSIEGVSCFVKDELDDLLSCGYRGGAYYLINRARVEPETFIRLVVTLGLGDIYWRERNRFLKDMKDFRK